MQASGHVFPFADIWDEHLFAGEVGRVDFFMEFAGTLGTFVLLSGAGEFHG